MQFLVFFSVLCSANWIFLAAEGSMKMCCKCVLCIKHNVCALFMHVKNTFLVMKLRFICPWSLNFIRSAAEFCALRCLSTPKSFGEGLNAIVVEHSALEHTRWKTSRIAQAIVSRDEGNGLGSPVQRCIQVSSQIDSLVQRCVRARRAATAHTALVQFYVSST